MQHADGAGRRREGRPGGHPQVVAVVDCPDDEMADDAANAVLQLPSDPTDHEFGVFFGYAGACLHSPLRRLSSSLLLRHSVPFKLP